MYQNYRSWTCDKENENDDHNDDPYDTTGICIFGESAKLAESCLRENGVCKTTIGDNGPLAQCSFTTHCDFDPDCGSSFVGCSHDGNVAVRDVKCKNGVCVWDDSSIVNECTGITNSKCSDNMAVNTEQKGCEYQGLDEDGNPNPVCIEHTSRVDCRQKGKVCKVVDDSAQCVATPTPKPTAKPTTTMKPTTTSTSTPKPATSQTAQPTTPTSTFKPTAAPIKTK
jgi:hypothetical protein